MEPSGHKESVFHGEDNRRVLGSLPAECVDLIYLDPPFFSTWAHEGSWRDRAEVISTENRWEGGVREYFDWMAVPLADLHRVLKPSGALFLICDEAVGLYIRVLLDYIFGQGSACSQKILCEADCGPAHHYIFYYRKSAQAAVRPSHLYTVIRRDGDEDRSLIAFSFIHRRRGPRP